MIKCLAIAVLVMSATGQAFAKKTQTYQGQVVFVGTELKEVGDSLLVSFDISVERNAVPACGAMVLTPELVAGKEYVRLPHVLIQGKDRKREVERWVTFGKGRKAQHETPHILLNVNGPADTILHYHVRVPYQMWMDEAGLVVSKETVGCRNEHNLFAFTVSNKVELMPYVPYQPKAMVSLIEPEKEQKSRSRQGQAFLDFAVGSSVINPAYRRNPEELAKIEDAVSEVLSNPDVEVKGIYIEGYASPEGSYPSNEKLSDRRANALLNYLKNKFRLGESLMKATSVAEDWEGLAALLPDTDVDRKNEIVAIIESDRTPDQKEAALKRLAGGAPYRKLLRDVFPMLRRVEYQIDYNVRDYNLEETKAIIGKNDELLSQRELYLAALSYQPDSREYKDIMIEIIPRFFPDDAVALNNAAAVLIRGGEYQTARRYLEKAGETPSALNNLGALLIYEGDIDKARELLSKAAASGSAEAEHNLAELNRKIEDNRKAERYKNRNN